MRPLSLIIAAALLAGCCQPVRETVMRVDTIRVPYAVTDSLIILQTDTCLIAGDDHIQIRIDTVYHKLWYKIRDTVTIVRIDTVTQYHEVVQAESSWAKLGRMAAGALIAILIVAVVAGMLKLR